MHERCAGLDVHKDTVVACLRIATGRSATREVKTFATTTSGLLELHDWLQSDAVTHVAMEATGVYWKPVWHLLEDSFT
jgi:transposase